MSTSTELAAEDRIITRKVDGAFADVAREVRATIEGKAINITHALPAGDMLHRTAEVFGYSDDVYLNAETCEFCSARNSQKLSYRVPIGKSGTEDTAGESYN